MPKKKSATQKRAQKNTSKITQKKTKKTTKKSTKPIRIASVPKFKRASQQTQQTVSLLYFVIKLLKYSNKFFYSSSSNVTFVVWF